MGLKDPDEFFQKEREWALAYGAQLKDVRDKFRNMVFCSRNLGSNHQNIYFILTYIDKLSVTDVQPAYPFINVTQRLRRGQRGRQRFL